MKIVFVGAGIGGLSASALLAKLGFEVTVLEKNEQAGGRASIYSDKGFTFDMGPSWYLMPDIFEHFFGLLGKKTEDLIQLVRLDPSYRVFFGDGTVVDVPADVQETMKLFNQLEENGAEKLSKYLLQAQEKYELAKQELLYRDYQTILDFFDRRLLKVGRRMPLFESLDKYVSKRFSSEKAKQILEYSIGFLGGSPKNTPSFYSIMSHIDLQLGVWYPRGGIGELVRKMYEQASSLGVTVNLNEPVTRIQVRNKLAERVLTNKGTYEADIVVVNADYAYAETELLDESFRSYGIDYWKAKILAPSAFIAFIGVNKKIDKLAHHSLFLDKNWLESLDFIVKRGKATWPNILSYYVNVPSKTDAKAAPEGCETLFVLQPLPAGLEDTPRLREKFLQEVISHLENTIKESIRDNIVTERIFALNDFNLRYNAFKGTSLGLSHTLRQTAIGRPSHRSKKVRNLFYTGQYTHPGIGVPMVLISSEIIASQISKEFGERETEQ